MGTGIPVPATIPEGSKAFTICVPDDPFFFGVVMGLLKQATFKYFWAGTEEQKEAVTERMLVMYYGYQDQVGCMDCANVAGCIEGDEDTQAAIASAIRSSLVIQQALNDTFDPTIPGTTVPPSYANQNIMDPATEECDNDLAWGHIRSAVDRWFQRVQDVLDEIELTTDNQEMLANTLDVVPVLGTGLRAAGVGSLIGWFDNVRAFLADAWAAGDTVDKRDEIACALFCVWKVDCTLSFDQIRQFFWNRAADNFPSYENAFTDIVALLLAMANPTELTGTFVVDCLLATEFGFTSFINDWFGVRVESMANDMLTGEPSDDWLALCDDCPSGETFDVNVAANNAYGQDSGHIVTPGTNWNFLVPGTWNAGIGTCDANGNPGTTDPSFWLPSANAGAFVGKWDSESTWFLIGTGGDFTVPVGAAALTMICNDVAGYPPVYADNSGTLTATITITP